MAEGNKYYQQLLNDYLTTPKNNDTKKLFNTYFDISKGNFFRVKWCFPHTENLTFMVSHIYGPKTKEDMYVMR